MSETNFLSIVHRNLIVSCQALEDEPLHGSDIMAKMAHAAKEGGAKAIRCNSIPDCIAIREQTDLPIIAIIKQEYPNSEVYITPTLTEVKALLSINPDVIALDATNRIRPNQEQLKDLVQYIHDYSQTLVMGDIATIGDAEFACESNVDILSSTLSGYTKETDHKNGPDFDLVGQLCKLFSIPIIAEGKVQTPEQATEMLNLGAWSVVVGGAITRPQLITKTFVDAIESKGLKGD